jgi:hypothetical protein
MTWRQVRNVSVMLDSHAFSAGRVPADQLKTSPCQIIDRLNTTDDQVERVPASGR